MFRKKRLRQKKEKPQPIPEVKTDLNTENKAAPKLESKISTPSFPVSEAKRVLYLSFDYDGCLGYRKYSKLPFGFAEWDEREKTIYMQNHAKEIAAEIFNNNLAFIKKIVAEAKNNYDRIVVTLGSNRQSFYRDLLNAIEGAGPSFPVLELITAELKRLMKEVSPNTSVELDESTLDSAFWTAKKPGDSDGGPEVKGASNMGRELGKKEYTKDGEALNQKHVEIVANLYKTTRDDPEWLFDNTKISLIYYQMQRALEKNPKAEIIDFHFYDDKYGDILKPLHDFFSANPKLIPRKIKLHLHNYEGSTYTYDFKVIPGEGDFDPNYENTVIALGAIALKDRYYKDKKSGQLRLSSWIQSSYKLDFNPKDKSEEEIGTRLEHVKKHVLRAAHGGQSIGFEDAPDVKSDKGVYSINVKDLLNAREFAAIAKRAELAKIEAQRAKVGFGFAKEGAATATQANPASRLVS